MCVCLYLCAYNMYVFINVCVYVPDRAYCHNWLSQQGLLTLASGPHSAPCRGGSRFFLFLNLGLICVLFCFAEFWFYSCAFVYLVCLDQMLTIPSMPFFHWIVVLLFFTVLCFYKLRCDYNFSLNRKNFVGFQNYYDIICGRDIWQFWSSKLQCWYSYMTDFLFSHYFWNV